MDDRLHRPPQSADPASAALAGGPTLILYDGLCGLCDRLVAFTLKRDREAMFRFAPLQSVRAREILRSHGADPDELDTLYLVEKVATPDETLYLRSAAVLRVLHGLGQPWRILSALRVVPTTILDLAYRVVARSRYRIFGRFDRCRLPDEASADRFISLE
jgi:predicted DCC family thiol-disulfide oxidoreductase YuxK